MVRKLKVYQTSQGFYDLAVAAPTMKAALEAWGAGSNLFQQGDAKLSDDRRAISSAMKQPGVVLRRPIGTEGAFTRQAGVPTISSLEAGLPQTGSAKSNVKPTRDGHRSRTGAPPDGKEAGRDAVSEFKNERAKQERQRALNERAEARAAERRKLAIDKAESALREAQRTHDEYLARISQDRAEIDRQEEAEHRHWEKTKKRLADELQKARQ